MKHLTWFGLLLVAVMAPVLASFPTTGPGRHETPLNYGQTGDGGVVSIWNTPQKVAVQVETKNGWLIKEVQLHVGAEAPYTVRGNPVPGKFPFKSEHEIPVPRQVIDIDLQDDLEFNWGQPWESERIQYVALHADLVQLDAEGEVIAEEGAWAFGSQAFEGNQWGWWFNYELAHPKRGHFIDSPVGGLSVNSPTFKGKTDDSGGFDYFPGERAEFNIGNLKYTPAQP